MTDPAFRADPDGLARALELLLAPGKGGDVPPDLPEQGIGEAATLTQLSPSILGQAADLGEKTALAHMDPPTPWISWAVTQWTASLNQNLLHPATSPVATEVEARVIGWLAPFFGMEGGHMTPGSTLANLTAIWAAREVAGVRRVVASEAAHVSIPKAAHLLGLEMVSVPVDATGAMTANALPDLSDTCLVLTAGTTGAGAIDPLHLRGTWTHVDAAWAGPLRLTCHADRLAGIEGADSVAISAHKWFYQPKDSALILFREVAAAHAAISFGASYLARPNVGVLGSRGAMAVPLLATLLAWGRAGMAARIEANMAMAERLAGWVESQPELALYAPNRTGVVLWRPHREDSDALLARLPDGLASRAVIDGAVWVRNVAANPNADMDQVIDILEQALTTRR